MIRIDFGYRLYLLYNNILILCIIHLKFYSLYHYFFFFFVNFPDRFSFRRCYTNFPLGFFFFFLLFCCHRTIFIFPVCLYLAFFEACVVYLLRVVIIPIFEFLLSLPIMATKVSRQSPWMPHR